MSRDLEARALGIARLLRGHLEAGRRPERLAVLIVQGLEDTMEVWVGGLRWANDALETLGIGTTPLLFAKQPEGRVFLLVRAFGATLFASTEVPR